MYRHEINPSGTEPGSVGNHAYRLKLWPCIPERFRTAKVLRACSRMSVGPVTANWFRTHIGLDEPEASVLLADLLGQGALERIELAGRPITVPVPAAPAAEASLSERLTRRLAWKHAAVAAMLCVGISAALEDRLPAALELFALPALPHLLG